jgi:hypothetical protein
MRASRYRVSPQRDPESDMPLKVLRYGLFTPVFTNMQGADSAWEDDATIEDIAAVATAADQLGYDHLTCSEPRWHSLRAGVGAWSALL